MIWHTSSKRRASIAASQAIHFMKEFQPRDRGRAMLGN
jgi:hypothetical protein